MNILAKTLALAATLLAATPVAAAAPAATAQRVTFESAGQRIVGELYLPPGHRPGERLPAVVVTGAWMTVKEQMAGRYAAELADRGYAALAFDFRGWGESAGEPRWRESPATKIEDVVAAADFLATRPEVDPARIGALGICASAGYAVDAALRSPTIRSVALVAPWLQDRALVEAVYGGVAGVDALLATSREARERARATGTPVTVPAASATDRAAIMFQVPYYTERDRGLIPEWDNRFDLASWEEWLAYHPLDRAARLGGTPVAVVHSEAAAIPDGAKRFLAALTGPKRALWLEGVGQFDFYDGDAPVARAADFTAGHFAATLR